MTIVQMKEKSKITQNKKIEGVCKQLEKKGILKCVKALNGKKVWFLTEITPDDSISGGLSGSIDFDLKKIEAVQELVLNYLKNHKTASEKELVVYIKQTGILSDSRDFSDEGIKKIL